jgi:D-xylose transport system substrate-binding protein
LLQPQQITPDNVKDVITDGYVKGSDVCSTAALKKACTKYGVSAS